MSLITGMSDLAVAAACCAVMGIWFLYAGFVRSFRPSHTETSTARGYVVSFLHPDFGIGGAENLIVNAAIALQRKGHRVRIFTAHHDPAYCFEETRGDGPLAACVAVYGDWLPKTLLGGRMYAFCAWIRMLYVALRVSILSCGSDAFIVDQVSLPVPLLRALTGRPVLFYGHFPDKLLCVDRSSLVKRLYRLPLDYMEEVTTVAADRMVVNSKFTAGVFQATFKSLPQRAGALGILYPPVEIQEFARPSGTGDKVARRPGLFVSLNRYERKKNVALAVKALVSLQTQVSASEFAGVQLVVAGGYDPQNTENLQHLEELKELAAKAGVESHVTFLTGITNEAKRQLLWTAQAVLYTPSNEHFGIVPVEAMASGTPVLAVSSGGPLESIAHETTGFLCEPVPEAFATAMQTLLLDPQRVETMGAAGVQRATELFSMQAFADSLDHHVRSLLERKAKAL